MPRTKLNEVVHEAIVESIRGGSFVSVAAKAAGIATPTFRTWMERGEMEEARIEEGYDPNPDEAIFLRFKQDVEMARAEAEIEAVSSVRQAARVGTWQAAAWYLERSFPQRWSRNRVEESSDDKKDVDPDAALARLLQKLEAMDSDNDQ